MHRCAFSGDAFASRVDNGTVGGFAIPSRMGEVELCSEILAEVHRKIFRSVVGTMLEEYAIEANICRDSTSARCAAKGALGDRLS